MGRGQETCLRGRCELNERHAFLRWALRADDCGLMAGRPQSWYRSYRDLSRACRLGTVPHPATAAAGYWAGQHPLVSEIPLSPVIRIMATGASLCFAPGLRQSA